MDLVKVVPKNKDISTLLIATLLKSKSFKQHCLKYKNGTTVLHLSKKALPEYQILFPNDLKDISKLEVALKQIYSSIAKNINEIEYLLQLKETALPKLMLENS